MQTDEKTLGGQNLLHIEPYVEDLLPSTANTWWQLLLPTADKQFWDNYFLYVGQRVL